MTDRAETTLRDARRADQAWRADRDQERASNARRHAAIKAAHKAGNSYGTIAEELGIRRSMIADIVKGRKR